MSPSSPTGSSTLETTAWRLFRKTCLSVWALWSKHSLFTVARCVSLCVHVCVCTLKNCSHVPQGLCLCLSFHICSPVFSTYAFSCGVAGTCTLSSLHTFPLRGLGTCLSATFGLTLHLRTCCCCFPLHACARPELVSTGVSLTVCLPPASQGPQPYQQRLEDSASKRVFWLDKREVSYTQNIQNI